jgi:pseudouridine-5'-phosphate glycosidase
MVFDMLVYIKQHINSDSFLFVPECTSTDFRIDRSTFEIILQTIAPHLASNNVSGKEQIPPEKTIVIVNMVHFKPGFHARSSQFIWHFDLDCS